jgi:hypothetical protein
MILLAPNQTEPSESWKEIGNFYEKVIYNYSVIIFLSDC